ncbi:MAG: RluA family pseudouridine synthase [Oscillospiraceae bacterium]|nr:RluA family pseudouridine synthase [Oscillospiraceae bacterium]
MPPGRSELILTVGTENAGERLDVFLARFLGSRSAAVRAAGSLSFAKSYRVQPGDAFNLTEFIATAPEPYSAEAEDIPLDIIYEDEDLIVVNKAKGIVVHPAPGHYGGTLVNALLHHCAGSLSGIGGELRPGIVHRIDKDTSGLLIVAKNDFAHRELAAQLVDHSLSRTYEAVIRGSFAEDFGTISQPLGRAAGSSPNDRKRMAVRSDGKPAITHWERIAGYSGYTHIRCKLETGRTHQIRVHLAYTGHPVLGDVLYGAGNKLGKTPLPFEGQCLHAKELTFVHPRTKETVHLESDLPEYFKWVLDILSDDG